MDRHSERLFLSVVTVTEIEDGIARAFREGATRKAALLAERLGTMLHLYSVRILGLDLPTTRLAGRLSDDARGRGYAPGFADLLIAATARSRGYVVLTRNLRHFLPLQVAAHDLFESLP